jgi:hypothetical protein
MTCIFCGTRIRNREGVGMVHEESFNDRLGCQLPTPSGYPVNDMEEDNVCDV